MVVLLKPVTVATTFNFLASRIFLSKLVTFYLYLNFLCSKSLFCDNRLLSKTDLRNISQFHSLGGAFPNHQGANLAAPIDLLEASPANPTKRIRNTDRISIFQTTKR